MIQSKLAYGINDAAQSASLSETNIRVLIARGTLPSFKVGSRRLIHRDDLAKFLDRCRQYGAASTHGTA